MDNINISNPMDYKVALYIRLSKEDDKKGESESISNQRSMLRRFCESKRLYVVNEYIDDGISGTTFNRPAFQKLIWSLQKICQGLVVTILVQGII